MRINYFKVTQEPDKLTVVLEVKQTLDKNPASDRKFYSTEDVRAFLKKEGYKKVGYAIAGDKISNFQGQAAARGLWVFSTSNAAKPAKTATITATAKPKPKIVTTAPEPAATTTTKPKSKGPKKRTTNKRSAKAKSTK